MWLSTLSVCNSLPRKLLHLYIDLAKHSDAKTLEHPPPFPCCYSHYTISLSVSQHKSKKNKNKKTKEETNFNLSFPTQKPTSKPLLSFTISHHHPKRFKILAQHTHKPIPPLCISVSLFFFLSLSLSLSLYSVYICTYSETSPESSLAPSLSTFKNKPRKLSLLSRSPFLLFSVYTCIWVVFSVNEL